MTKRLLAATILLCSSLPVHAASQKIGTLKGKIENKKGKPVAGAEVRAMSSRTREMKETTTDQSGNYQFQLEADDYVVSFDAEGFQGGTLRQMQQVEEGKETQIKTIRLPKAKRTSLVRGAVFDSNGLSLGGARVKLMRIPTAEQQKEGKRIESLSRDYTTNSRGEFAFRLPPSRARYQLTATLAGYKPETKIVDVSEDEAVPVAFSLEPLKKQS
jgi:uncharacterized GH25 family protein